MNNRDVDRKPLVKFFSLLVPLQGNERDLYNINMIFKQLKDIFT